MFTNFQVSYFGKETSEVILNRRNFLDKASLVIIDCSKQIESLKYVPVDARLEFESSVPFPPNTEACCRILHDRMIQYKPISGEVKRIV